MTLQKWKVGHAAITSVPEFYQRTLQPTMLPDATPEALGPYVDWLKPNYLNDEGLLRSCTQTFVVQTPRNTVVVDTGFGNGKQRRLPRLSNLQTPFLEDFRAEFDPEKIDFVVCTHIHTDHVGWNTRLVGSEWVPTFPNAKYLISASEWEVAKDLEGGDSQRMIDDSIRPVQDAGLLDFFPDEHKLTDEITLITTPGHTAGHTSVLIESDGQTALITGDAFHHPIQVAEPSFAAYLDYSKEASTKSREAVIEKYCDTGALIIGNHFHDPSGGYIVSGENGRWFKSHIG